MAKGVAGGQLFKGMLRVDLDIPIDIRLDIDGGKLERNVGNRLASRIRKLLKAGKRGDGSALPHPKDGGKPLKDSGELINSIKYSSRLGWVAPSTSRRSDVSSRAGSNYGLLGILISGVGRGNRKLPDYGDVLGSGTAALQTYLDELVSKELARQMAKPSGGLKAELKRITKKV